MDFNNELSEETKKIIDDILSVENRFIDSDAEKLKNLLGDTAGILCQEELAEAVKQINRLYATTLAAVLTTYNLSLEDYLNDATITTEKGTVVNATTVAEDFFRAFSSDNKLPTLKTLIDKIVETREKTGLAADNAETQNLPVINGNHPTVLEKQTTKIYKDIFHNLFISDAKNEIPGQYSWATGLTTSSKADKKNGVQKSISYMYRASTALLNGENTALNEYDERVFDALMTLYDLNGPVMLYSSIYEAMGRKGEDINSKAIKDIDTSLKKLSSQWIKVNQLQDYSKYQTEPTNIYLEDEHQMLYFMTRAAKTDKGQVVRKALYVMEEPVLLKLAKDRKQIAEIPLICLQTGKRQTKDYLKLENYIITRIAEMKNEKRKSSNIIRYSTLFEHLGITGTGETNKKKRSRTLKTLYDLLEHYQKNCKWIKGYEEHNNIKGEPGVEIKF